MDGSRLLILVCVLAIIAYILGRQRAVSVSGGSPSKLRSLPSHYGTYTRIFTAVPALLLMLGWSLMSQGVIDRILINELPLELASKPAAELNLLLNDVKNAGQGLATGDTTGLVA